MNRRLLLALAIGALASVPLTLSAQAQTQPVVTKATTGTGAAADTNVKGAGPVEDATRGSIQPQKKGGAATRAALAEVHIDNWTPRYINIYVDGYYAGQVAPWGDLYFYVHTGSHTLYGKGAIATTLSWGPMRDYIGVNGYKWQLTP